MWVGFGACLSHKICFSVFGHSGCFYLLGIVNHVAMIMGVQMSFFPSWFQFLWINTQKWGWWNIQCFRISRATSILFSISGYITNRAQEFHFLHIFINTYYFIDFFFLHNVYSIRCGYLIVALTSFSLMMNNVECLFLYLLVIYMSFSEKCVLKSFAHFVFLVLSYRSSL